MEHLHSHHVFGVSHTCGFDNVDGAVPVTGGMDPIADSSNLPAAVMQQEHMRSDRVVSDPHSGHAGDIHKAFRFSDLCFSSSNHAFQPCISFLNKIQGLFELHHGIQPGRSSSSTTFTKGIAITNENNLFLQTRSFPGEKVTVHMRSISVENSEQLKQNTFFVASRRRARGSWLLLLLLVRAGSITVATSGWARHPEPFWFKL